MIIKSLSIECSEPEKYSFSFSKDIKIDDEIIKEINPEKRGWICSIFALAKEIEYLRDEINKLKENN